METTYKCKTPCKNCPYRKDAPLQLWSVEEFKDLAENDSNYMGKVYGCHKKNGSVCVGWLMDQDKRYFPSIALRLSLAKNNITRVYLDALRCKSPLYSSIQEMSAANYPEQFLNEEDKPLSNEERS
jgi:hypothetical protein